MPEGGGGFTTEIMAVPVPDRGRETSNPPVRPSARLICVVGHDVGRSYSIDGAEPAIIGRGAHADIEIAGTEISRRHAQIVWHRGRFVISDLGSRNGTLVNGEPIEERALASGDRIQLGGWTVLVFSLHDALEERAMRLQKLESLAALTGGIVHDFKNTLGVILTNAELLGEELKGMPRNDEATAMVDDIVIAAKASLETARRLLYFANREEGAGITLIPLRALLDEVVSVAHRKLASQGIRVGIIADSALQVRGRHDELHHVLLNLVLNARDAMPSGGTLELRAGVVVLSRSDAFDLHLPSGGAHVEIVVSDTGSGMDADTLARAFEPFFTTKPRGQGTGLGLATVFGVIRYLGGSVLLDSAPGRGTRVRLLLPEP
jgi:signal transduction histidine kinase